MKIAQAYTPTPPPLQGVAPRPHPEDPLSTSSGGRGLVPFDDPLVPQTVEGSDRTWVDHPLAGILTDVNARAISPRAMQSLSLELYAAGILSWEEHADLSFQPELHPDFNTTIGALTGEKPLPDQPRDYVQLWQERLDFAQRHAGKDSTAPDRALHILSVLRRIDDPTDLNI